MLFSLPIKVSEATLVSRNIHSIQQPVFMAFEEKGTRSRIKVLIAVTLLSGNFGHPI